MEFKGSKTEKNLWSAFAGESQARNKYIYFAQVADQEGVEEAANLFKETATQEENHAKSILRFLNVIHDTKTNLKSAAQGENYESDTMYKEFERVASEEGFHEIASFFREIAKVEAEHERKFMDLLRKLHHAKETK